MKGDRLQRLLDAERRCSEVLSGLLERHKDRTTHAIHCSEGEWDEQSDAFAERDAARAALMPTEQDAIKLLFEAYTRLKDLGWNDIIYCPKDGSEFDAVEVGSTGIHKCHYQGEWATGSWWYAADGDLWPARPSIYRVTERELAARETMRAKFREMREAAAQGTSAGTVETQSGSGSEGTAGPVAESDAPNPSLAPHDTKEEMR